MKQTFMKPMEQLTFIVWKCNIDLNSKATLSITFICSENGTAVCYEQNSVFAGLIS